MNVNDVNGNQGINQQGNYNSIYIDSSAFTEHIRIDAQRIPNNILLQANWRIAFAILMLPSFMALMFYPEIIRWILDFIGIDKKSSLLGIVILVLVGAIVLFTMVSLVLSQYYVNKTHQFIVRNDGIHFKNAHLHAQRIYGCEIKGIFKNIIKIYWIGEKRKQIYTSTYRFTNKAQALFACAKIRAIIHNPPGEKRNKYGMLKY